MSQTQTVLRTLDPRPDHEFVDTAKQKLSETECIISEKERSLFKKIMQLEMMHDAYEKLLKDAEKRLVEIYENAKSGGAMNEEVVAILHQSKEVEFGKIDLSNQQLRFLPEAFGKICGLKVLNLSTNQLQTSKVFCDATRNCQNSDPKVAIQIAREVATTCRVGLEVAIVVGGRNFFSGDSWISVTGFDRPTTYQIGKTHSRVQSAFTMPELVEPYNRQRVIRHLEKGSVVIFGGVGVGTRNPLFSTDTASTLRASEINADALLKGTNVNGIFDFHFGNSNIILDHISFRELASRGFTSMDMMTITYCEENGIHVVLFNLLELGNISRALCGNQVSTLIDQGGRIS
ncbi:hypothetical protein K2173_001459 [Erythroxylum novogranatense]|uniref:UMP kinase n=1 Tax=Erythroxylum novogranatense TaxID=1862640 RepID=A0AAV8TAH1_9ROSI|nr:hypothetical protein K2173_001459 [Erythroxylum novogranatense]